MDAITPADPFAVATLADLERLYAPPAERARRKVVAALDDHARKFIAAAPYCILSTTGPRGAHATPRGDAPGFVASLPDGRLALPDRRGNNRIEALRDIVADPRVALLFLIPGVGETLRVNGTARLTTDPALTARFAVDGKPPVTVILVNVEEVYMHCARATLRAGLWRGAERPAGVPTAGQMLEAHTGGLVEAESYQRGIYDEAMRNLY